MKLRLECPECYFDQDPLDEFVVEFRDDGLYELTCSKGHKIISILRQFKFEILSTIAAYAIKDGYYREAVSSFTSSLERFYEFYIKTMLVESGISSEVIAEAWNTIASQSERQLGAFILLYTNYHKQPPALLSQSKVSFRNDVIHKGKIPTKAEAIDYGNSVLNLIRPVLSKLKSNYRSSIDKMVMEHIQPAWDRNTAGSNVTTISTTTIISIDIDDENYNKKTIEDFLSDHSSS